MMRHLAHAVSFAVRMQHCFEDLHKGAGAMGRVSLESNYIYILYYFVLPHQIGHRARVVNGLDLNHTDQSSNGFGLARSNRVGVVTTLYFCDRYVYAVSRTHFLPTSSCRPCACNVVAEFGIFMHFK